jgi:O-antigen/teichoic acid export membrane protein
MLISFIGGDFMAGQFRVIDQIVSIFKTYLNMFFYFVYANICYELNKSISTGIKVWKQYNGLNFCFILILLFFFFFNTELILGYFKIDKSSIFLMSNYFKIALLVPLLVSISQPLRQLMFAFNHNKTYISITIISTVINFVLLYFLTKTEGLKGAFHSIIIIEFIIIVLYLFILRNNINQNTIVA